MTRLALILAASLLAGPAAACFADYKAKQDDPLRLHYGVMELEGACSESDAEAEVAQRLEGSGWQLLTVESIFEEDGLEERQDRAGEYYLRY